MTHLYSKNGYELTKKFESCRTVAYQDQVGVWTIGWGHTRGVAEGLTCMQSQADQWLIEDVSKAEAAVNAFVHVAISQDEFDALVDFAFNLGTTNLQNSTLLRLLNNGDYAGAAAEFDKWDHAGGKEVAGLLTRRQEETALFNANSQD